MMPDPKIRNKTAPFVTCPLCGKEHQWDTGNRFRPFCSERCKLIDLGKWANEEYRIQKSETGQREQDSGDQETQA
jgi:endogenous inhibitor of DNA gyrase (YacG/DUF329 family)